MNDDKSLYSPTRADLIAIAERELGAFLRAVTELFGPEQARLSAEDWLEELELTSLPGATSPDWRPVTIAASVRLASRLTLAANDRTRLVAPTDTKVSPIPSSNCSVPPRLA